MKTFCTLYAPGANSQEVEIEYSGQRQAGRFIVEELIVLSEIRIECDDIYTDIAAGIAKSENEDAWSVQIKCDIEYSDRKKWSRIASMNENCQLIKVA